MVVTVTCRGGTAVSSHGFRASGPASVQPDPTICLRTRSGQQDGAAPQTQHRRGRAPRASHTARPRASGSVGWTGARRWPCRPGGCPHPSRKAKPGHPAPSQRRLPPGPPALLSTGPRGGASSTKSRAGPTPLPGATWHHVLHVAKLPRAPGAAQSVSGGAIRQGFVVGRGRLLHPALLPPPPRVPPTPPGRLMLASELCSPGASSWSLKLTSCRDARAHPGWAQPLIPRLPPKSGPWAACRMSQEPGRGTRGAPESRLVPLAPALAPTPWPRVSVRLPEAQGRSPWPDLPTLWTNWGSPAPHAGNSSPGHEGKVSRGPGEVCVEPPPTHSP